MPLKPAKPMLDSGHLWSNDEAWELQCCMLCDMNRFDPDGKRIDEKCKHDASKRIQDIIDAAWDAIEQIPDDRPMTATGPHLHMGVNFADIDPDVTTEQLMAGRVWQVPDVEPKNTDFADLLRLLQEIGTAIDDTPNPVEQYAEIAHEIIKAGFHR